MDHSLATRLLLLASLTAACSSTATDSDASIATGPRTTGGALDTATTTADPTTTDLSTDTTDPTTTTVTTTTVTTTTDPTTATTCAGDCDPLPCPKDGGVYCGGNGVGGDPQILYICESGSLQLLEACGEMCTYMPLGTPDQCPGDLVVPPSLIDLLDAVPYVEQDCAPTTYNGWPHDALLCTYTVQGVTATVTVADPSPERVGAWIVDAAGYIPALAALAPIDPGAYEQGLGAIGLHMLYQSSRIFPLTGDIVEDLGNGPELFPFNDGVSDPCGSGCYCRINSLHRTDWCGYRQGLGDSYDACIAALGESGHTPEWGAHCLGNHIAAWNSDANEHFRARAYLANKTVAVTCPPDACTPAEVVSAVKQAYGL